MKMLHTLRGFHTQLSGIADPARDSTQDNSIWQVQLYRPILVDVSLFPLLAQHGKATL